VHNSVHHSVIGFAVTLYGGDCGGEMKFLHTADWQIGMKALHVGAESARVRAARIETAAQVVEVARAGGAEFVLIAGDTFECNAIDRTVVQKIGDILAGFGGPVFLLPGNHDPLDVGSVWEHAVWSSHSNLHVLREAEPVELPSGILYPCPILAASSKSKDDPTEWIPCGPRSSFRVGMAHGSVEGNPAIEPCLPISREASTRRQLDYLALGHWHSTATYENSDGAVTMAYSGTHEATSFGERDSGNVLMVEIPEPGAKPEVQTIPVGRLRWEIVQGSLTAPGQLSEIRTAIETMPASPPALVQVRLSGLLFADEAHEIQRIEEILHSRFLHGRIEVNSLVPAPTDDNWITSLPRGFLRNAAAKLSELANSSADENSRAIAARALRELYATKKEVAA
jgi:DNA repair exonuclease SbcCD nuclease subunit